MLDLRNKAACIFGLPDSGKSTLANFIASQFGAKAFIFDTMNEFPDKPYDSYVPRDRRNVAELENVTRKIMASREYALFLIDETNRYCPSKPSPLPQAIADLNDFRAHYDLAVIYIARRPVQLNQDLTELAHFLFIFRLTGKNDIQYLNDIAEGLGDAVSQLKPFHFMGVFPDRSYSVFNPVKASFKTDKKIKKGVKPDETQSGN